MCTVLGLQHIGCTPALSVTYSVSAVAACGTVLMRIIPLPGTFMSSSGLGVSEAVKYWSKTRSKTVFCFDSRSINLATFFPRETVDR